MDGVVPVGHGVDEGLEHGREIELWTVAAPGPLRSRHPHTFSHEFPGESDDRAGMNKGPPTNPRRYPFDLAVAH